MFDQNQTPDSGFGQETQNPTPPVNQEIPGNTDFPVNPSPENSNIPPQNPPFQPVPGPMGFGGPYGMPPQGNPPQGMPPRPPKKNKTKTWIVVLAILYAILVGGIFLYLGLDLGDGVEKDTETDASQETQTQEGENPAIKENPSKDGENPIVGEDYDGSVLTAAEVYERNVDCVVFVQANYAQGTATGSGFVIDSENGYILTNYHVVADCKDVAVTFSNNDSYTAQIVGGDEINDIAVLKIKAEKLKHVTVGNSDNIKIGNDLYVIGNPLGDLTFTMTSGIVSGVDRSINTGEYNINTFQTDAAINSGNSGGPAFDPTGAVVGIVSAKYAATGVEGLGFCIPINDAMRIARDLVEHGFVTGRPNFGITVSDSTGYEYSTDEWGRRVIVESVKGAKIEEVGKDSCAAKAGLQPGDVVTKFNDTKIETANDLINAKNKKKAGDTVTLEVYRDGEKLTMKVTLDEYTPQ